jgi:hypothetical protein
MRIAPDACYGGGVKKPEEVPVETIIDRSMLEELRAGLRGVGYVPGEEGYDEARKAWNLNAHQHPELVVMAAGSADVIAAVRLARDESDSFWVNFRLCGVALLGHRPRSARHGNVVRATGCFWSHVSPAGPPQPRSCLACHGRLLWNAMSLLRSYERLSDLGAYAPVTVS